MRDPRARRDVPLQRVPIALLAATMALAALGIDLLLPAFADMRAALGMEPGSPAIGQILTAYFLGMSLGQIVAGPVADALGRRPVLYASLALYAVGALLTAIAPTLATLIVARFVWGLGGAGTRAVAVAIIRDVESGDQMARTMSFIMAVFLLVPIAAPAVGTGLLVVLPWRGVIAACAVAALGVAAWALSLPETLAPSARRPLRPRSILAAAGVVVRNRQTVMCTLATAGLYGIFTAYLGSSEAVLDVTFDRARWFPVVFGGLAGLIGVAMLANSKVVATLGARRVIRSVIAFQVIGAVVLFAIVATAGGRPTLAAYLVGVALLLTPNGLLLPNLQALAMEPMGAVAGTASALIGAVQVGVGALIGGALQATFDGTVLPLATGWVVLSVLTAGLVSTAGLRRVPADPGTTPAT